MRAELVRLQAAFPGVLVRHLPGLAGPTSEAWRETGTGDLYAVIAQDARKLWRELEAGRARATMKSGVSNRAWCLRWKGRHLAHVQGEQRKDEGDEAGSTEGLVPGG